MIRGWPVPVPVAADALGLSRYGASLLDALGQGATPPVGHDPAAARLLAVLTELGTVVQSANPAAARRRVSWWGRLLGRDVEQELDAHDSQSRLGVLLVQAEAAAQGIRAQLAQQAAAQERAADAAITLDAWADAGQMQMTALAAPLQDVLAQRLDHLRRLAALQQVEAGQWQLLREQNAALLARSQRITETLLPAWRQTVLARRAGDQQQRDQQAAQLLAQISAEVDSAQARLD